MTEETTQPVKEKEVVETTEVVVETSEKTESAPVAPPRAPVRYQQRPSMRSRHPRTRRARVCQFCVEKIDYIDYKKPELLLPYISPYGKMLSRRRTGVCAKHQRRLAVAIKRARFLALLPYTAEHIRRYGS